MLPAQGILQRYELNKKWVAPTDPFPAQLCGRPLTLHAQVVLPVGRDVLLRLALHQAADQARHRQRLQVRRALAGCDHPR